MQPITRCASHWGSWYQKSRDLLEKELTDNMEQVPLLPETFLKGIVSP